MSVDEQVKTLQAYMDAAFSALPFGIVVQHAEEASSDHIEFRLGVTFHRVLCYSTTMLNATNDLADLASVVASSSIHELKHELDKMSKQLEEYI